MKNVIKVTALVLLSAMFIGALAGCGRNKMLSGGLVKGDVAPDFTVDLVDGGTFTLSDAKDKVVILNFWATWCGPCCEELPAFQKLYEEYGDRLQVIAVDYCESEKEVKAFIQKNGYSFPVGLDPNGAVSDLYPTDGIPYTLIIDGDGNICETFLGSMSVDEQYKLYKNAIEDQMNE